MLEVHAEHEITCIHCGGCNVAGSVNEAGQWHGYCLTCGGRFWDDREHLTHDL